MVHRHLSVLKAAFTTWKLWEKSGLSPEMARYITKELGRFKGPLLKAGQLTAMVPDLLPKEFSSVLETLCQDAPSMGWPFVRRRMASELGPDWKNLFQFFSPEASFSASLGQVHQAGLQHGPLVACKLQYPGMDRIVDTDLRHIAIISWFYQKAVHNSVNVTAVQQELKSRLEDELDYVCEARHMAWFRDVFKNHEDIHVPLCYNHLSTRRLLTMSWCDGIPLKQILEGQPLENAPCPHKLGVLLLKAWYTPFYQYGLLHGDPHQGNFSYGSEGLNVMDFGCVRSFSPSFVHSVCTLYQGVLKNDSDVLRQAYEAWGFQNISITLMEALSLWTQFLFKPFLKDCSQSFDEVASTEKGKNLVVHIHSLLRQSGQLVLPPEFLIMDRVAVVLGSILIRLKAKANWHEQLHQLMDLFSQETCHAHQEHIGLRSSSNETL
jgi:predicted unusual protein kinase regulating ubiquinone biosynthesis (AarF/ABC1/UbiB family)